MFRFKGWLFILMIVSIHILILSNIRFTVWPETILYPYLYNLNYKLYSQVINPYFPMLTLIEAGYFKLVGISILNLKIFTYLIIAINDSLFYLLIKRITKDWFKILTVFISYIFLQIYFGGNGLWFELALVPPLLGSLLFITSKNTKSINYIFTGILFAVAVTIKQNALLFNLPILIYLYSKKRQLGLFLIGQFIIYIFLFIYLFANNILSDFINWTVILPLKFSKQHGFVSLPNLRQYLLVGLLSTTAIGIFFNKEQFKLKLFLYSILLISILFAFPRYEDFHLQIAVVIWGILISFLSKKQLTGIFLITLILFTTFAIRYFRQTDRFISQEMFNLSQEIKNYDSVYLLNTYELSYFFANKYPPIIYATNFPWYFENFDLENKVIQSLIKEKTNFIVIGKQSGGDKYQLGNYIPDKLLKFIHNNYNLQKEKDNLEIWQRK